MTNATFDGKPDAGNPSVRFDEENSASAKPRQRSLPYKKERVEALAKPLAISAYGGHREGFWKEKMPV